MAETRAYEAAQNLRRIGNYQGAIVAFQSFIKQYPKSPLAPSAQYWIGDSYFNLRDFRLAINSQRLLMVSYPENAKVPDALLNIARLADRDGRIFGGAKDDGRDSGEVPDSSRCRREGQAQDS